MPKLCLPAMPVSGQSSAVPLAHSTRQGTVLVLASPGRTFCHPLLPALLSCGFQQSAAAGCEVFLTCSAFSSQAHCACQRPGARVPWLSFGSAVSKCQLS